MESAPQRVAALYGGNDLDNLLALGVVPVVAGDYGRTDDAHPFADYLGAAPEGVEAMPSREPNLERLAELAPDLIFSTSSRLADNYATISEIAPTIAIPRDDLEASLWAVACSTGTEERAEALLAAREALIAHVANALQAEEPGTVAFIETDGTSLFCVFNETNNAIQLFDRIGIPLAPGAAAIAAEETKQDCAELSPERIGEIDADRLFVFAGPITANAESVLATLSEDPLWQTLPAVQAGDVHLVDTAWLVRASVLADQAVLDDIAELYDLD